MNTIYIIYEIDEDDDGEKDIKIHGALTDKVSAQTAMDLLKAVGKYPKCKDLEINELPTFKMGTRYVATVTDGNYNAAVIRESREIIPQFYSGQYTHQNKHIFWSFKSRDHLYEMVNAHVIANQEAVLQEEKYAQLRAKLDEIKGQSRPSNKGVSNT